MRRLLIAAALIALLAFDVGAKMMVLVSNNRTLGTGIYEYVKGAFATNEKALGFDYVVFDAADTTAVWAAASSGTYSMAICLNLPPLTSSYDTDAELLAVGWPLLGMYVDRGSAKAFPIPLMLPLCSNDMVTTGVWASAYTGQIATATLSGSATEYHPFKSESGDSIYCAFSFNGKIEPRVAESDSTGFDFSYPLFWRYTAGTAAVNYKYAHCWMTKGTGAHKVIYLKAAQYNYMQFLWPTVIGMFEKIAPLEFCADAYLFGFGSVDASYTGADTVGFAAGFKAIKEYCVDNGIKLELSCLPRYMQNKSVPADKVLSVSYANAYPANIRLTASNPLGWRLEGSAYPDYFGGLVTGSYSQKVARIKVMQDSCTVYFPSINTATIDAYDGIFSNVTTNVRADSSLMAAADRDVTDIYNDNAIQRPLTLTKHIVGPQRTWVKDIDDGHLNKIRFHPKYSKFDRYDIQNANSADTLKIAYINTAAYSDNRATWQSYIVARLLGQVGYLTSSESEITTSASDCRRLPLRYQPRSGFYLPAYTFAGGSKTSYAASFDGTALAKVDSTRSVFLECLQGMNALKSMSDYMITTHGTLKGPAFVWAWRDEVKYDRRNRRQYANDHVSME